MGDADREHRRPKAAARGIRFRNASHLYLIKGSYMRYVCECGKLRITRDKAVCSCGVRSLDTKRALLFFWPLFLFQMLLPFVFTFVFGGIGGAILGNSLADALDFRGAALLFGVIGATGFTILIFPSIAMDFTKVFNNENIGKRIFLTSAGAIAEEMERKQDEKERERGNAIS